MSDSTKSPTSSAPQAAQPTEHNVCAIGAAIINALRTMPCSTGVVLPSSSPRACCIGCGFVPTKLNATQQATPGNHPCGRAPMIAEAIQSLMSTMNLPCPEADKGDFGNPIVPKSPLPPDIQQPNLMERLPSDLRDRLVELGRASRTALGKQWSIQAVVNRDIDLIKCLRTSGVSNVEIVELLHDVGVRANNDRALPLSTLSSAISRATRPRPAPPLHLHAVRMDAGPDQHAVEVTPAEISASQILTSSVPSDLEEIDELPPRSIRSDHIRAPPVVSRKPEGSHDRVAHSAKLLRQLNEE